MRAKTRPLRANDPWMVLTGRDPDAPPTLGQFLVAAIAGGLGALVGTAVGTGLLLVGILVALGVYYAVGWAMVRRRRQDGRPPG